MEAENMVHSDSMSPASLGICEKLFRREQWSPSVGALSSTPPRDSKKARYSVLLFGPWAQGTNNSKRPIPNPKAQGSDPLVHRGELSNTWRLSWGAISKPTPASPPLTLGNSRVVEGPAPLKEAGFQSPSYAWR
ncbi:hypothetical protein L3Q82_017091 [Scortum barcoo]|uniref:Uncharacterized protein n=1 Tax=Scortum barcoo TaxID=214431 RepID=A0ACB8X9D5_9TELE|nr:hypothetical protein L3Q82_017091 [Scortum barcoo]